eukprot:4463466-Prymnesium_polylepis.1
MASGGRGQGAGAAHAPSHAAQTRQGAWPAGQDAAPTWSRLVTWSRAPTRGHVTKAPSTT